MVNVASTPVNNELDSPHYQELSSWLPNGRRHHIQRQPIEQQMGDESQPIILRPPADGSDLPANSGCLFTSINHY